MALKTYEDVINSVYTKGNKMDFSNAMIRGNGIPLDITDIYNSIEDAVTYASNSPLAYEGQIITVKNAKGEQVAYILDSSVTDQTHPGLRPVGIQPDDIVIPEVPQYTLSVVNNEDNLPKVKLFKNDEAVINSDFAFTDLITATAGLSVDAATDKLMVNTGAGLLVDEETDAVTVNTGDGLKVDETTNAVTVNTGNGLKVDEATNKLEVIINTISCGGAEDF